MDRGCSRVRRGGPRHRDAARYPQQRHVHADAERGRRRGDDGHVPRLEHRAHRADGAAHRGHPENGEHYFQEVHVTSEHNFHFAKTIKKGKAVIMLVTKKTTNIGMGWAQLKAAIPSVEPLVP